MQHEFVENIPETLIGDCIYISLKYNTAIHLCSCGCKNEVITPFSKQDWSLSYNGSNVSLSPSIGNWGLKCQSHYWIKKGKIVWVNNESKSEPKFNLWNWAKSLVAL